jgi:sec-independent protein translocase protein TatB
MFDIGFPELLIISIVALLVIGPDKLPETIRAMSLWMGRFRRSFAKIKQEIENEIGADEIKAQLYNESIMEDIEKSRKTLEEVKDSVTGVINEVDSTVTEIKKTPANSLAQSSDEATDEVSGEASGEASDEVSDEVSDEDSDEELSKPLETKPLQIQE